MIRANALGWACALAACACGASPREASDPQSAPVTRGDWTFYGTGQGLSGDVHDVSADEGGNVYVAGGDALYVKRRDAASFLRFDAANAGLTRNCNDHPAPGQQVPDRPFYLCPVISVAGASPGKAIVGFRGLGQDADVGVPWVLVSGGADVVAFDAERGALSRSRHVQVSSPPRVVCGIDEGVAYPEECSDPNDYWWNHGRRMLRQVFRIVVNHDPSTPMYGDAWIAGDHGTFSVLLANAAQRGWTDRTASAGPDFADAKDVWEHLHPSFVGEISGLLLIGSAWALSIDPRNGVPWGSNGVRTAWVGGYGPDLSANPAWWMGPWVPGAAFIDLWPDLGDEWLGPTNDRVKTMSHCPDGTLWIGSTTHGLARIDPGGSISYPALPAEHGAGVSAVACDPTDGSVWVGPEDGGVLRLRGGGFEPVDLSGLPGFLGHKVVSIQLDRWSSPRVAYFAFAPTTDAGGRIVEPGGVAAFKGP